MAQITYDSDATPEFDHGDGRQIRLLDYLFSKKRQGNLQDNPLAVVEAIDQFVKDGTPSMTVGPDKGVLIIEQIKQVKPQIMVELGGFVGYSAVLFGNAIREASRGTFYSLEYNPLYASITMAIVKLAGLQDTVKVVVGASSYSLERLHKTGSLENGIDLLFLDHYKPAYTADLKLCENLGLIHPGSVLVADNVVFPGNPVYMEYVRKSVEEKRKEFQDPSKKPKVDDLAGHMPSGLSTQPLIDVIPVDVQGNPDLVYETTLHEGFRDTMHDQPDGVAISRCVGA